MSNAYGLATDSSGFIYVADRVSSRIVKWTNAGVYVGWVGKILASPTGGDPGCNGASGFTPGWCTGGTAQSGPAGTGVMNTPYFVAFDSQDNMYVADKANNRVNKYTNAAVFVGWIGKISTSPTSGDPGCNGATVGTFTPGWCKGGQASAGMGDGMFNAPAGMAFDSSDNLYVVDQLNHRVNKYTSGATFVGWMGNIGTSPSGGDPGCSGATVGTFTPGWCKGGTSTFGTGDGMLNSPWGIAVDLSSNIYVADTNNGRVNKYNSNAGFVGWAGKIATSPTGGSLGCAGATVGTATVGWCKGGTGTTGNGNGMLSLPGGIAIDNRGYVYVGDRGNNRIMRFTNP